MQKELSIVLATERRDLWIIGCPWSYKDSALGSSTPTFYVPKNRISWSLSKRTRSYLYSKTQSTSVTHKVMLTCVEKEQSVSRAQYSRGIFFEIFAVSQLPNEQKVALMLRPILATVAVKLRLILSKLRSVAAKFVKSYGELRPNVAVACGVL